MLALGGAFEAIDELKGRLVRSHAERMRRIEYGELTVVGVNRFTETAPSPLTPRASEGASSRSTRRWRRRLIADVQAWRAERDNDAVKRSLDELRRAAEGDENIMAATIDLAHAGGTTGEWAGVLREVFGEYRAPTGVARRGRRRRRVARAARRRRAGPGAARRAAAAARGQARPRRALQRRRADRGRRPRRRAWRSIYQGIRLTPEQIAAVAGDEDVDVIGLSILSGSHLELVPEVVRLVRDGGVDAPVVVGGIIPEEDRQPLLAAGVAAVYTPKDFELVRIMGEIVDLAVAHRDG